MFCHKRPTGCASIISSLITLQLTGALSFWLSWRLERPSRWCLLSANIIIQFVCLWWRRMCSIVWAIISKFMPSLKVCQVFLQQPVSYLLLPRQHHAHSMYGDVVAWDALFFTSLLFNLHRQLLKHCGLPIPIWQSVQSSIPCLPLTLFTPTCGRYKLWMHFPFGYCVVNALLLPIQLGYCGNTV